MFVPLIIIIVFNAKRAPQDKESESFDNFDEF